MLPRNGGGGAEAMSLTGLELEALEMMSVIVKNWDTLVCDLDTTASELRCSSVST